MPETSRSMIGIDEAAMLQVVRGAMHVFTAGLTPYIVRYIEALRTIANDKCQNIGEDCLTNAPDSPVRWCPSCIALAALFHYVDA
jgi:hypothetical protein